jgi:hypothetical protein
MASRARPPLATASLAWRRPGPHGVRRLSGRGATHAAAAQIPHPPRVVAACCQVLGCLARLVVGVEVG